MNGKRTKTWNKTYNSPGNEYIGEYKDGLKHGERTLKWANGDKYVGLWRNNMI